MGVCLCVCVCACTCTHVHMLATVHMAVEERGQPAGVGSLSTLWSQGLDWGNQVSKHSVSHLCSLRLQGLFLSSVWLTSSGTVPLSKDLSPMLGQPVGRHKDVLPDIITTGRGQDNSRHFFTPHKEKHSIRGSKKS